MLQPTEMYLVLTSLMILPGMIVLSWLALSGAFDRIESVKYIVVSPDEDEFGTDEDGHGGAERRSSIAKGL